MPGKNDRSNGKIGGSEISGNSGSNGNNGVKGNLAVIDMKNSANAVKEAKGLEDVKEAAKAGNHTEPEGQEQTVSRESGTKVGTDVGAYQESKEKPAAPVSRKMPRWVLLSVVALVVMATGAWWLAGRNYESTDDAQVEGRLDLVSSRISGTVSYINPRVENNQFVEAGTLLMELDPRDYQAELEHAKANLDTWNAEARSAQVTVPIVNASSMGQLHAAEAAKEQALAQVKSEQANLTAAQHQLQRDEALAARAERDRSRYKALVEKREISRSEYDAHETDASAALQAVEADRAEIASREEKIAEARSLVAQRDAQLDSARSAPQQIADARAKSDSASGHLEQARADLHTAELNVGYTKIYAPISGVIGRKTVELGHRVQPGQSLMAIVPIDDIWITANFKETQLRRMKAGQPVTIHVDTFGRDYRGKVESLPGAAGPLFSLFPPENSTGNYVKVVQRFPVRIRLEKDQDPEHLLRPGMSVEPTVGVQ
ncbi:MAG TPA: HlyD family secretion protein [Candidatus Angelobacter sp.]|nr:HlyD family secretion protein [Candidatus Angelobacter sp.]